MTSLAAVISKPDSRGTPCELPPRPITMCRSARSFMSRARFQRTRVGSRSISPKWRRLSIAAASRLCAAVIAWKSPVNWRLIVLDGSIRLAPPPVAPPLRPNTGPIDGWRSASAARLADPAQTLGQADRRGCLPLAGRRRGDRRNQDQLARGRSGLGRPSALPDAPSPCLGRTARGAREQSSVRGPARRSVEAKPLFPSWCGMRALPCSLAFVAANGDTRPVRLPDRNTGRNRSRSPVNIARSRGWTASR